MDTSAIRCKVCRGEVRFDPKARSSNWYHRNPQPAAAGEGYHQAQPDLTEWEWYTPPWFDPKIPDLLPGSYAGFALRQCTGRNSERLRCHRPADHTGRHARGDGRIITSVWGDRYVKPEPERVQISQITQTPKWAYLQISVDYYTALINMYVDFIEGRRLGGEFNAYAKTYTPRLD